MLTNNNTLNNNDNLYMDPLAHPDLFFGIIAGYLPKTTLTLFAQTSKACKSRVDTYFQLSDPLRYKFSNPLKLIQELFPPHGYTPIWSDKQTLVKYYRSTSGYKALKTKYEDPTATLTALEMACYVLTTDNILKAYQQREFKTCFFGELQTDERLTYAAKRSLRAMVYAVLCEIYNKDDKDIKEQDLLNHYLAYKLLHYYLCTRTAQHYINFNGLVDFLHVFFYEDFRLQSDLQDLLNKSNNTDIQLSTLGSKIPPNLKERRLNFSNLDLSNINLSNITLTNAKFVGTILSRANLEHSILIGADFTNARINGANFLAAECNEVITDKMQFLGNNPKAFVKEIDFAIEYRIDTLTTNEIKQNIENEIFAKLARYTEQGKLSYKEAIEIIQNCIPKLYNSIGILSDNAKQYFWQTPSNYNLVRLKNKFTEKLNEKFSIHANNKL